MDKELGKLRRRPFLFPLVVPFLVLLGVLGVAVWLFDARASTVVIVVRNAEVASSTDPDPGLSIDGRERAARLARVLSKGKPERGIDAIFALDQRSAQDTVLPVSSELALPINAVTTEAWAELPQKILREYRGQYVLVAGNAKVLPQLIEALTGEEVSLREDEYDAMFVVFAPQVSKRKVLRLRY